MSKYSKCAFGTFLSLGLCLSGCETANTKEPLNLKIPMASLKAKKQIPPTLKQVLALLQEEKYNEASSLINQNLQTEPRNITLHLLNSLVYEKLNELGNAAGQELAAIGYQNVINLDPTNAFALSQLGKLRYREQKYDQAQEHFANALLIKPKDANLWQELAAASYYNYDLKTALASIDKAISLNPNDALAHRSASMIYAALGDFNTSKKHLDIFTKKAGDDPAVRQTAARYDDWKTLYNSGRIRLASTANAKSPSEKSSGSSSSSKGGSSPSTSAGSGAASSDGGDATSGGAGASDSSGSSGADSGGSDQLTSQKAFDIDTTNEAENVLKQPLSDSDDTSSGAQSEDSSSPENPQIVIDCYLLRIGEDAITSKGNNILENLAITLTPGGFMRMKGGFWGGALPTKSGTDTTTSATITDSSGFRSNQSPATDNSFAGGFQSGGTTLTVGNKGSLTGHIFTGGITWAGLTYSLNIANARDSRTEVVSRPSLMTFLKKPSIFFSGNELVNGFTGQFGGTLVKYPVGVTLDVTPTSLKGDLLELQIGIEGSLLTEPNPNLQQTVNVGKTRVDTYAKLHLGETLMLGGMYERLELTEKSGFPGLQDIPVAQYFFSNEATLSRRTSIVFMLTPRSPDAVKAAVNRAMAREAVSPQMHELIARNPDWFNTHPNMVPIFRYMAWDPVIYYEFRSNDILPPSWGWEPPLQHKLAQVIEFLYY